ncbi:hypothetical protein V6N12_074954 [Hibiscus sabdariffa]|uniref:Uncharacterized protein n=1 Tax=Hibiscus sabdariffa TaxID=183260 RepID=A0ABR1ZRG7_9ROSI
MLAIAQRFVDVPLIVGSSTSLYRFRWVSRDLGGCGSVGMGVSGVVVVWWFGWLGLSGGSGGVASSGEGAVEGFSFRVGLAGLWFEWVAIGSVVGNRVHSRRR